LDSNKVRSRRGSDLNFWRSLTPDSAASGGVNPSGSAFPALISNELQKARPKIRKIRNFFSQSSNFRTANSGPQMMPIQIEPRHFFRV
jgi:hypothetical protein